LRRTLQRSDRCEAGWEHLSATILLSVVLVLQDFVNSTLYLLKFHLKLFIQDFKYTQIEVGAILRLVTDKGFTLCSFFEKSNSKSG
jgi:hypothetical protein